MDAHSNTLYRDKKGGAVPFAVALIAVTALALLTRLYRLDFESLWYDELTQVSTYELPLSYVVTAAAGHGQPPLDYLLGAGLHRLGLAGSDWWVRFPGAVFGAISVMLTGLLARRIAGATAGITSALLLTVCPLHVVMSQEARPYTIFVCFALVFVFALEVARRRHTWWTWLLFTGATTALLLTRWVGPQLIVAGASGYAMVTWLASRRSHDRDIRDVESQKLWAFGTSLAVSYAIYGPVLGLILDRARSVIAATQGAFWARYTAQLAEAFQAVWSGYSTQHLYRALPTPGWLMVGAGLLVAIGFLETTRTATRRPPAAQFLIILVPFGILYAALYATLARISAKPQYLLLMSVPLVILVAVAVTSMGRRLAAWQRSLGALGYTVLLATIIMPMGASSWSLLHTHDKRDWRRLMTFLCEHAAANDAFAVMGADTVPASFHPAVGGKTRYGMGHAKFLPVDLNTTPESLTEASWREPVGTVWIVGIKDRLYAGHDQLPAPSDLPESVILAEFPGLFVVGIRGTLAPPDRLALGLSLITNDLPDRSAVVAPLLLRGRLLLARGATTEAAEAFARASRQCRTADERETLRRDYLPQEFADPMRTALRSP